MILKKFFICLATYTSIAILPIVSFCSLDKSEHINTPESTPPVITLSQPLNGVTTSVDDTVQQYRLRGTITLSSDVTLSAFSINGTSYIDSVSTSPKEFAVTFSLVEDTTQYVLNATDNKNKTGADTVTIIRSKSVITQNEGNS